MKADFKYSISVATEPVLPSAPIVYRGNILEILQKTKSFGYDAIELQLRNPQKINGTALKAMCDGLGMSISAIATGLEYSMSGLSMIDDDEQRRAEMREKLFADVELAQIFDCPVIIGCVRGNIPPHGDCEAYLERFAEEMCLLSDKATAHGVTIVLEAINFYVNNYLCTVRDTCDFIDRLGRKNIKLHIDTHHMAIEEGNSIRAIHYAGKRIGYVHFCENNRMYPGACGIDFLQVMQALVEVDYHGYIALEITPRPTEDISAKRGITYLKTLSELVEYAIV